MAKDLHIKIDDIIGAYVDEFGFVWPGFMAFMLDGTLEANPDAEHITLHADCPGGDIIEGYRIINRLEAFKRDGGTVRIINEGMSASMMTAIMQAASPGMREALPTSTWMMHKPLYEQLHFVNSEDLRKLAIQLDNFEETLVNLYVKASGNTPEQVIAHFEEEIFVSAEEAVRRGYLDKVVEGEPSTQPKRKEAMAVAFYKASEQPQTSNNEMTEEIQNSLADKIVNGLKGFFGPKNNAEAPATTPVAASTTLADGSSIFFEGELAVDTKVFTDEALASPLADGTHELSDGRTITVAAGAVSDIAEAATEDPAATALAQENEQLKAELETLKATALRVPELEAKITALQATVPGGGQKPVTPPQNFTPPAADKGNDPFAGAAQRLKNKYNKK